jgi:putative CocE/NonD family hydrolase
MTYPVKIEFNVPALMRDGTKLRANIFRPADNGEFPVALNRTPYGKDLATSNPVLDAIRLAREGFIVIIQDVRGRFDSEGEWYPLRHESADGYDSVEWAARLPGSNGSVGMFGASYTGFTQWAAAMQAPPHLKALMPTMTWADMRDGASWRGGALELGTVAFWLLEVLAFDVISKRYQDAPMIQKSQAIGALVEEINRLQTSGYESLPLASFEPLHKMGVAGHFFDLVKQPNVREAHAPYSAAAFHYTVGVPAFNVGGWYDIFAQGTIQNYIGLRRGGATQEARQSRLLMGPWSHSQYHHVIGELDFGFGSMMEFINVQTDLTGLTQRWFDYWLMGKDNGITREPPVQIFIMGDNVWRSENEFPLARTEYVKHYLHRDGILSQEWPGDEPPDHYEYDPAHPTPTSGGAILMNGLYNPGVRDQRQIEARGDVLTYTSAPLAHPVEVTGPVTLKLWAASDARDTDFVGRLVDVHPDGFAQNLTDGIIRARYRNSDSPELLEPGKPYELHIDLWSTANVFKAGHRVRLDIASASFPRWDRNPNTGAPFGSDAELRSARQTVYHDAAHPSHVVLPIIPA